MARNEYEPMNPNRPKRTYPLRRSVDLPPAEPAQSKVGVSPTSPKGGRPTVFRPEFRAAVVRMYPNLRSMRAITNRCYYQRAYQVIQAADTEIPLDWLYAKKAILSELGRIRAEDELLRVAVQLCAVFGRVQQWQAFLSGSSGSAKPRPVLRNSFPTWRGRFTAFDAASPTPRRINSARHSVSFCKFWNLTSKPLKRPVKAVLTSRFKVPPSPPVAAHFHPISPFPVVFYTKRTRREGSLHGRASRVSCPDPPSIARLILPKPVQPVHFGLLHGPSLGTEITRIMLLTSVSDFP